MKNKLRKWAKEQDKSLKSRKLAELMIQTKEFRESKNIMLFYPLAKEVNLLALLDDKTKNFFLPRIDNDNILCCPYKTGDVLTLSRFNTHEPVSAPVDKNTIDLVIIPALCCDKNNYRLGYGKGFYDRFLQDFKGKTIICIPEELIVETVYPESHDIPAGKVISC